jgi:hypothetical protein
MTKWTSLMVGLACLVVAPLWMAPGETPCPSCQGSLIDMLIRQGETGWQEFAVTAGRRQFVRVSVLEGQAQPTFVRFDSGLKLRKWGCVHSGAETRCDFFPETVGQLGVAVEALEDADVELEYGVADAD